MAEISRDQLNEVVARVMNDVAQEVKGYEKAFRVTDLQTQLAGLAKVGGQAAWTISYSTSSASIAALSDRVRVGGEAAWTISYSTSSAAIEKALTETGR
jgi:hypothetical protein